MLLSGSIRCKGSLLQADTFMPWIVMELELALSDFSVYLVNTNDVLYVWNLAIKDPRDDVCEGCSEAVVSDNAEDGKWLDCSLLFILLNLFSLISFFSFRI